MGTKAVGHDVNSEAILPGTDFTQAVFSFIHLTLEKDSKNSIRLVGGGEDLKVWREH